MNRLYLILSCIILCLFFVRSGTGMPDPVIPIPPPTNTQSVVENTNLPKIVKNQDQSRYKSYSGFSLFAGGMLFCFMLIASVCCFCEFKVNRHGISLGLPDEVNMA